MNENLFPVLRNLTTFFASVMLLKYFVFLMVAPFHTVKERLRQLRLTKSSKKVRNEIEIYRPLVSVIVPAWNEEVGLTKTITSIVNNSYKKVEIIVVNDGSTDQSDTRVKEYLESSSYLNRHPEMEVHYFYKENGGKGTALNHGIQEAKGEVVLTVDADSVLHPQAIAGLVKYFADPKIDAAVGNVKVVYKHNILGLIQSLEYLFGFYFKRAHSVLGAEYIYGGACAAFRKTKTFDTIGLFDTTNKTEDIEMSMRTRYHGLHSVYAEDVICYTEGASTIRGLLSQRLRWKKGRFDTFVKYRRLFFSLENRHNKFLTWFIMPYALFSELQLLFEPIGITLLVSYSIISGDYLSLGLGMLFLFITYLVAAIFNHEKVDLKLLLLFPITWPVFYFLVWVEYVVLLKSLVMILRGDEIVWQKWDRIGVEAK